MKDVFHTIAAPQVAEFKDRGSKFLAYAFPVQEESEALAHLEALRKEHFKANHHCFAWRLGPDGQRFRANDDGEPSGTAGRPILGQIDAFQLTDVAVVVVRYFGGTLLGTSGLIHAYKESTAAVLKEAVILEKILKNWYELRFDYALMPDIINAVKKQQLPIRREVYTDSAVIEIGIRCSATDATLLQLRALILKTSTDEALTLDWPAGLHIELLETTP
jgi:uncharacterized YigZ family protein